MAEHRPSPADVTELTGDFGRRPDLESGPTPGPSPHASTLIPSPTAPKDSWAPDTVGGQGSTPSMPSPAVPLAPPTSGTFGDHDLLEEIARGGMGVVFKARHRSLGRIVALKMILQGTLASNQIVQRFHQEARAAAALDHPGIVPIFDIGQINGQHYFTMAFVEGTSLAGLFRDQGLLPLARALSLMQMIAAAVAHAHDKGIVHRDLKPDNVLIDQDGRPRITDFGLAKLKGSADSGFNLTGTGQILGTPAYMAPEQALGEKQIGTAADIYSLGGIFYYMLTGQAPFTGSSLTDILFRVVQKPPAPPRQVNPDIPVEVEAVCLKCLEKDPQKRYASTHDLVSALAGLQNQPAPPRPVIEQTWPGTISGDVAFVPKTPDPTEVLEAKLQTPAAVLPSHGERRPPVLALSVAGLVVLAGAAVALAVWGPWSKRDAGTTLPDESSRAEAGKGELSVARGPRTAKGPEVVKAPTGVPEWLLDMEKKPSKGDFGLQVTMVGVQPDANGVLRLREGQVVQFRIELERDAYLAIWTVDPDGDITQLYPTGNRGDYLVKAGKPHLIPDRSEAIEATLSTGLERIVVLGSTEPWTLPQGERDGAFMLFKKRQDREKWQETLRGMRVRAGLAQQVLPYQVAPRE